MTVTSIYWRQFSVSKRDRKMEERKFYHRFALGGAACNVLISTTALAGACLVFSFDNYSALCFSSFLFLTAIFAAGNVFLPLNTSSIRTAKTPSILRRTSNSPFSCP